MIIVWEIVSWEKFYWLKGRFELKFCLNTTKENLVENLCYRENRYMVMDDNKEQISLLRKILTKLLSKTKSNSIGSQFRMGKENP